jgi:16S rRNA (uracil1498-N3)-methyltransferase
MRLHRFVLDVDLSSGRFEISDRETTNQIRNVLRLGVGDRFVVCDGKGREAEVEICEGTDGTEGAIIGGHTGGRLVANGTKGVVSVVVSDERDVATEGDARVVLYCAVLKREHFEVVAQKATECGASMIVPVVTARTVKLGIKTDRLRKIAREAAEQSGRGVVPEIADSLSLKDAVAHAKNNDANVFFQPGSNLFDPLSLEPNASRPSRTIGLFIGPEGGWDSVELDYFRAAGFCAAGLGPRILRAETAAAVAVFLASVGGRRAG